MSGEGHVRSWHEVAEFVERSYDFEPDKIKQMYVDWAGTYDKVSC